MKHWNDCELPDNGLFPERYTVREIIRDSVASTILLGSDKITQCDVVIKCFKPSAKGAYLREIGAAFDIRHPHVVRCLDTFHRTDGIACIVYEYLAGGSLSTLLETQGKTGLKTIVTCLRAMLSALIYLHGLNRIHCDIKPENILLRPKADGQADYVLIDLGAACVLREAQEGNHVTGTPAYIAPERIRNRFFFNSDLYSLGVIAFEMSTGKRPFTGTIEELTQANLSEQPSLADIQPPALRDFIDHLLVKNPLHRIENAALALTLLKKVKLKTHRLRNNPGVESNYAHLPVPIADQELSAIHCFHVNGHPLIGLVYAHYVDIVDPLKPQYPIKTLLTGYPLQILGSDKLAYATPSRVQIVDLSDSSECLIKEQLHDLKAWHVGQGKLLWRNSYYFFHDELSGGAVVKFSVLNYLFGPKMCMLTNNGFVTTEGIANNNVVLRDEHANKVQEWLITDSVVALSHHNTTLLAVTLNLNNHNTYTLHSLTANQSAQKLGLPDNVSQILCINGVAFWLVNQKLLYCCDSTLIPQTLNAFADSVFKFAVSHDHCFIVAAYTGKDNKLFLTILKNRSVP